MRKLLRMIIPCRHEYMIDNIKMTGIPPLPMPLGRGYDEWSEYYRSMYNHESHTKRVSCECRKCGEVAYAHCGLMLNGRLIASN